MSNHNKKTNKPSTGNNLWDVYFTSEFIESTASYSTSLPNQPKGGPGDIKYLPSELKDGQYVNFIRAQQFRQSLRKVATDRVAGTDREWRIMAGIQSYQGGFMVAMTLADKRKLKELNPVVYLFGTASVPGTVNIGHLYAKPGSPTSVTPITRTNGIANGTFRIDNENAYYERQKLVSQRGVFVSAKTKGKRNASVADRMNDLKKALEKRELASELAELTVLLTSSKASRQNDLKQLFEDWLDQKIEGYASQINSLNTGMPSESLQQIQQYQTLPAGTQFTHRMELFGTPLHLVGLFFKALYNRKPVLGAGAARDGGAYLKSIYRISACLSKDLDPPKFSMLLRIERGQDLKVAFDDIQCDTWDQYVSSVEWFKIGDVKNEHFIHQALTAWNVYNGNNGNIDMDFVPNQSIIGLDDADDAEEPEEDL